ncbi:MAG: hypothetical protein WC838_04515 [Candidatus Margulisiibacteriota bacterium]|jgi:hypothetical protein
MNINRTTRSNVPPLAEDVKKMMIERIVYEEKRQGTRLQEPWQQLAMGNGLIILGPKNTAA